MNKLPINLTDVQNALRELIQQDFQQALCLVNRVHAFLIELAVVLAHPGRGAQG